MAGSRGRELDFWEAQQHTNAELEPEGLYVTHLFRELEVILTPDWLSRRVRIPLELRRLAVFRPATLDLILTKMARGDENDLADIEFLLTRELLTSDQLRAAFARARVPDIPETQAFFLPPPTQIPGPGPPRRIHAAPPQAPPPPHPPPPPPPLPPTTSSSATARRTRRWCARWRSGCGRTG